MKLIALTRGLFAKVDDSDFEELSKKRWKAIKAKVGYYAARTSGEKTIYMHRAVAEASGKKDIDHRDGDKLNNQRYNLRSATRQENKQGFSSKKRGASSIYRGVSFHRRSGVWHAMIRYCGVNTYLGSFRSEKNAALAYDFAARLHFGEFAQPNFKA